MTNRENQHRLDRLAMTYLAAIDREDFDTIDALWSQAEDDAELAKMLHGLNDELATEHDESENARIDRAVIEMLEKHIPSGEEVRPATGVLSVSDAPDHLRKNLPPGLSAEAATADY